jgi:hypothetical protein
MVGFTTDWIDWSTNKNCSLDKPSPSSSNLIRQENDGSIHQHDESRPNGASADWRANSDQAYAKFMNESSYSSLQTGAVCRSVVAYKADIDTTEIYPTLNFKVGWIGFHDHSQSADEIFFPFLSRHFLRQIIDVECFLGK